MTVLGIVRFFLRVMHNELLTKYLQTSTDIYCLQEVCDANARMDI